MYPHPTRNVVVFDVDGTIANSDHRDRIAPWRQTDAAAREAAWQAYYAACTHDAPIEAMFAMAWALSSGGWRLYLATGRPVRLRRDTVSWCIAHNFPAVEALLMRPEGVRLGNADMKVEHARHIGPERIALWIDDHPDVAEKLRPFGIPVLALHNEVWNDPEDTAGAAR